MGVLRACLLADAGADERPRRVKQVDQRGLKVSILFGVLRSHSAAAFLNLNSPGLPARPGPACHRTCCQGVQFAAFLCLFLAYLGVAVYGNDPSWSLTELLRQPAGRAALSLEVLLLLMMLGQVSRRGAGRSDRRRRTLTRPDAP